jgi:hypothetical protein
MRPMGEVLSHTSEAVGVHIRGAERGRAAVIAHAMPNQGLERTAYSVRSCVAPASSRSSGLALDGPSSHPMLALSLRYNL